MKLVRRTLKWTGRISARRSIVCSLLLFVASIQLVVTMQLPSAAISLR